VGWEFTRRRSSSSSKSREGGAWTKQQQEPSDSAGDPKAAALYNNTPPLYNILYYKSKALSRDILIYFMKTFSLFLVNIYIDKVKKICYNIIVNK
jgi:hypothetical protein